MFIEILKAFFFGLVEGITEWLPVSSTGHLVLFDNFVKLSVSEQFMEMFTVVIQLGAILAVIILYFSKLNPFDRRKTKEARKATWVLWAKVVVGCIPAAIIGFTLEDWVDAHFYRSATIAAALIFYGVIFIVLGMRSKGRDNNEYKIATVHELDFVTALKIGCFQCLAIIPGTSRSGSTIIGGLLCGCSRVAVSEFSFFLAIPVMFGWSALKLLKFFVFEGLVLTQMEIIVGLVGLVTAFVVSVISIRGLMSYIQKHDFTVFGVYRIILAVVVLVAVFFGYGV